jgi:hypothetical protein
VRAWLSPFGLCSLATALPLVGAALAASGGAAPSRVLSLLSLAFLPYAGLLALPPGRARPLGALVLAGATGLTLVAAPSVLSDDVYRYRWDARVSLAGIDPYAHPPEDPALAGLRDAQWRRINHREIPTIYPPLAQGLFVLAFGLWPSTAALKLLALLCHLLSSALLARAVDALGEAGGRAASTRATALLALNPLALSEAALGGHVDAAMGLCVLALAIALHRRRPWRSALLMAAASGIKLASLVALPLLWRFRTGALVVGVVLSLLALLPLSSAGHASPGAVSGVAHYAQRWRGNEGPFAVLELATTALVDVVARTYARDGVGPREVELPPLRPLMRRLTGGRLDPNAALRAERKQPRPPAIFDRGHLSALLARGIAAALCLGLAVWLALRGHPPAAALRAVLLSVLLLAPQVHPWYLLWLLPLELALGRRTVLVWSAVIGVAYLPLDGWLAHRQWVEAPAARVLEYGLVLVSLAFEQWSRRASRAPLEARVDRPGSPV